MVAYHHATLGDLRMDHADPRDRAGRIDSIPDAGMANLSWRARIGVDRRYRHPGLLSSRDHASRGEAECDRAWNTDLLRGAQWFGRAGKLGLESSVASRVGGYRGRHLESAARLHVVASAMVMAGADASGGTLLSRPEPVFIQGVDLSAAADIGAVIFRRIVFRMGRILLAGRDSDRVRAACAMLCE